MKLRRTSHGTGFWRGQLCLLALLTAALLWAVAAPAMNFSTTLDRDEMALGDTATLSLVFEGGGPQGTPSLPDIPGLTIRYVGPSSQFSFVNGQTSSTITHHFIVSAQRPGVYTIPALTIQMSGATYTSQALQLKVAQANSPDQAAMDSGAEQYFAKIIPPKNGKLYVGEMTTAELQLWLRDDIVNFGNIQLPSMPADGFNVGKLSERQRHQTRLGNHVYTVVPIGITLTAVKSGTLTLGPLTAQMVIVLQGGNQGGDPFFRQFFNTGEQKQIELTTAPAEIQALKLPGNPPPGFTGAIGRFRMNVTEGPTTVSAGDPITIRVRIEGRGALDSITLPDFSTWNGFKTYPPTSKVENNDPQGFQGVKTFEQIVTPQNTEVKELPAFTFTYFDPEAGTYQTLRQAAMPITVRSVGAAPVPTMAAAKTVTTEAAPPQADLLPAKESLGTLVPAGAPLLTRPGFLALQSVPLLALLAAFIWRRSVDQLANNPRLRRQRAVAELLKNGQADLQKFAAANQSEEFFATLFRLMQEVLGERLDCPASAITESVVDDRLRVLQVPAATLNSLRELFQLCNQARYAPVRDRQELAAVAGKFSAVAQALQTLKA